MHGIKASRLYYGWIQVVALSVTMMVSWGATYYAFSVVLTPMRQTLGWSVATLTGAFSISMLISGLAELFVGRWLDRHGPRALMTVGSILAAGLLFAWSRVDSVIGFYLVMAALGVVGAMVQYLPAFWLAAHWFKRKRSLALTIITVGGGLASTVFVPLTNALLNSSGWRNALAMLALIVALVTIAPHALLLRRKPSDINAKVDGDDDEPPPETLVPGVHEPQQSALKQPVFWLLAVAFALIGLAFNGISVHLLSYELARGQDATFAASAAGLAGVMQVVARLLIAPLGDRISRKTLLLTLIGLQSLAYLSLLILPMSLGLIAHVILRGLGAGPLSPIRAGLLADVFGVRHYGRISGQLALITGLAGSASPFLVGWFVGIGGYAPVIWSFLAATLVATVAITLARLQPAVSHS
jgi:MFS family permease